MSDPQKRILRLVGAGLPLALWGLLPALGQSHEVPSDQLTARPAPVEEVERGLLVALNRERTTRKLPALSLSADLVRLARKQSGEMAQRGVLSHLSAAGKSFTDRLAEASVAFVENGENVARSETYVPKFIHQSFMDSPGHRENVLNPEFDEVGIGVVRGAGGAYYVTEDFIKSLVPRPAAEVRALVLGILNDRRAKRGLPLLVLVDDACRTAERYARDKASGLNIPPLPAFLGATFVSLAVGPDIDMVATALRDQDPARHRTAGLGVAYGRSSGYPGGAYFVCALFLEDSDSGPGELERALDVLKAANAVREKANLRPLEFDDDLACRADAVIALQKEGKAGSSLNQTSGDTFFFMFKKLDSLDGRLKTRLEDPTLRKIGISTLPVELSGKGLRLGYAVAVVLAR